MLDKFLKVVGVIHPTTRQVDIMMTLVCFVVVVVCLKFFLTGVVIHYGVHSIDFGSSDGWAYGSVLSPVLAAQGFNNTRPNSYTSPLMGSANIDRPEDEV